MSALEEYINEHNARMGGKIEDSIRIPLNKYGYQIDLSHPLITPYYERFLKYKNLSPIWPISDEDRFEFEEYMFQERDRGKLPRF